MRAEFLQLKQSHHRTIVGSIVRNGSAREAENPPPPPPSSSTTSSSMIKASDDHDAVEATQFSEVDCDLSLPGGTFGAF